MKQIVIIFLVFFSLCTISAKAQVTDTTAHVADKELPADVAATPSVQSQVKTAVKAQPRDTIKGNAGRVVALMPATGACNNGMKSVGITNKSADRMLMAKVDMIINFSGKMTHKSMLIDNLVAGETRYVGCMGCVDNATGKTCTTYKIIAAAYK
jgi:hypothetical protein